MCVCVCVCRNNDVINVKICVYERGRVGACVCPVERIRVYGVTIFTGFGQVITRRNGQRALA